MAQTKHIKVVLLGGEKTGKTNLMSTLRKVPVFDEHSESFHLCTSQKVETKANVSYLWDTDKVERHTGFNNNTIVKDADIVWIVLNPRDIEGWPSQIEQYTLIAQKFAPKAKVFYVVTCLDELKQLSRSDGTSEAACIAVIKRAHKGPEEGEVFFYSAKNMVSQQPELRKNAERMKTELLDAMDDVVARISQASAIVEGKKGGFITWPGFFKLLFLFVFLSTVFLASGGLAGGLEHIWLNINELFEAIKLGVDWGIGVAAASGGLAFVITAAVALGYYFSGDGNEPISINQDGSERTKYSEEVTDIHKPDENDLTDAMQTPKGVFSAIDPKDDYRESDYNSYNTLKEMVARQKEKLKMPFKATHTTTKELDMRNIGHIGLGLIEVGTELEFVCIPHPRGCGDGSDFTVAEMRTEQNAIFPVREDFLALIGPSSAKRI